MSKSKFQKGDLVEVVSPKKHQGERGVIKNMVKIGSRAGYRIPEIDKTRVFYSYELEKCVEMKFKEGDKIVFTDKAKKRLIDKEYNNLTDNIPYCNRLKYNFKEVCNRYLEEFCNRHDYAYYPKDWIGGEVGGIIEIADMFVTMDNIRYDVDNDIPVEKFSDWYWNSIEHSELGLKYMNYPSYCEGAPDPYTQEQIQSIREGQRRISQAKEDLRKTMDEIGGDFSKLLF